MECIKNKNKRRLQIETEKAFYEVEFGPVQIEITGHCNMKCQHCRAAHEAQQDLPIEQIIKILKFARHYSPNYKEIIVSGGEPLLHKQFFEVLEAIRNNGGEFVSLTTNGLLLTKTHLEFIKKLRFKRFTLSISLDSSNPKKHDDFRQHSGAFEEAKKALQLAIAKKREIEMLKVSIRSTIKPYQISEMKELSDFAYALGCDRISFSSIHPVGRGGERSDFWMNKEQKYKFLQTIYELKKQYPQTFVIRTNDPLKCLMRGYSDIGKEDEIVFDGCVAGAVSFNVRPNGDVTPCALMDLSMFNVFTMSIDKIEEAYCKNGIVKNLLDMNLKGKCGECNKKYQCGGCRARALMRLGGYLEEDPDCWL